MEHKENEEVVCNKCKNHMKPKKEKNYKQSLPCIKCERVFNTKPALKKHLKLCMLGFICPLCGKCLNVCTDIYTLYEHSNLHHPNVEEFFKAFEYYIINKPSEL